jgi:hypothetical protein
MSKSKKETPKGMKSVDCREGCGHKMDISNDSVAGTCWRCVNKMMSGPAGRMEYVPDEVLMSSDDNTEEIDDGAVAVPSESWND